MIKLYSCTLQVSYSLYSVVNYNQLNLVYLKHTDWLLFVLLAVYVFVPEPNGARQYQRIKVNPLSYVTKLVSLKNHF